MSADYKSITASPPLVITHTLSTQGWVHIQIAIKLAVGSLSLSVVSVSYAENADLAKQHVHHLL